MIKHNLTQIETFKISYSKMQNSQENFGKKLKINRNSYSDKDKLREIQDLAMANKKVVISKDKNYDFNKSQLKFKWKPIAFKTDASGNTIKNPPPN